MEGSLAYAGVVTILGMGVVFSFLALLSVGMVGLRRLSRAAEAGDAGSAGAAPAAGAAAAQALGQAPAPARRDARWVAAAVTAYLAETGRIGEVSAVPWDPARRAW